MLNLICRQNIWYFNRRVPAEFKAFDSRLNIRISLKTKCKKEAVRLAGLENTRLLEYWKSLLATGKEPNHNDFAQVAKRSEVLGFQYVDKLELVVGEISKLVDRLLFVFDGKINPSQAEAVLGMVPEPEIMLSQLLEKYIELKREVKLDKSDRQYKKWENPRILAMNNFVNVVTDKPVQKLDRQDMLDLKDWWIDRIAAEHLSKGTANKNMQHVKSIVETVCKNLKIKIDRQHLFEDVFFRGKNHKERLPFSTDHIRNILLNPESLKDLSDHYQKMIWVFAETGAHIDEQVAIRPENIFLDHEIPHVAITSHDKDKLKTVHRERVIPLVGYALDAFKAYPQGFSALVENPDKASSAIGKYLRENELLPSDRHSLYSLRHSFQDRLTNSDCPDRIQTDLMGHAFKGRTKYGTGASLEHALNWMSKIQLKI
ncbi:DUF6538 domain-containing protein [Mucilaginibacter pedocola]|uniref:Tyr recombinase domain-containing protein n=1 Tax=Mucilaginibacter pedocola TaxID=1792845 RepID=A0A1S9P8V9_9SPHI|nr:DUF6538 domain-containing protein [Mucilaginibacter pedocola]OOQ57410.1 hypothetical protein BC343_15035 [Mucilaginibacter pedocola]